MSSQYPGWNPYIYGQPEPESSQGGQESDNRRPVPAALGGRPGQPPQAHQGPRDAQRGQGAPGKRHGKRFLNGIDLDDPSQNPAYGHWDPYAVIAFIMALFLPVPLLSALMGGIAIYRTRTFRMKGFGLAVAAVVINLIYTCLVAWMALSGMSADAFYQQMMQSLMPGQGGGGSSDQLTT
ncbi:hypothetical protein BACT_0928 [Bifidobacterium actinocoloniiforme DSM 22766]|uniref:DUF4190 domain-containing protein n=1 Tax=Bifidobacterium actinocoloniiforme DSM 22766 TaxID=1437605 RepID=A0A086Z126_9BIFI|nr:hypothetical protein [Bifidobacterium actinocoloniiforme]KFI40226.1 hypothetical protein BACT_0928 [Bifidobacterium actinocoloniiforme DSM 22766]